MAGDWEKKIEIQTIAHKFKGMLFVNKTCIYLDFNLIFVKKKSKQNEILKLNTGIIIEIHGNKFEIFLYLLGKFYSAQLKCD